MAAPPEDFETNERRFIEKFFNVKVPALFPTGDKSCTEDDCMQLAKKMLGTDDIRPVENQGMRSFTVISRSRDTIVQFRLERLNEEVLKLAYDVYGSEIPKPSQDNEDIPLPVYTSSVIPGKIHFLQDFPAERFPLHRQKRTVSNLARFYTRALAHA